jgi:hypothetical protein
MAPCFLRLQMQSVGHMLAGDVELLRMQAAPLARVAASILRHLLMSWQPAADALHCSS